MVENRFTDRAVEIWNTRASAAERDRLKEQVAVLVGALWAGHDEIERAAGLLQPHVPACIDRMNDTLETMRAALAAAKVAP